VNDIESTMEIVLLPFVLQQAFVSFKNYKSTSITAGFCTHSYKITMAKRSTQIFISFILFNLVVSLALLVLSRFDRVPETVSSGDIDIIGKLQMRNNSSPEGRLSSRLFTCGSRKIV